MGDEQPRLTLRDLRRALTDSLEEAMDLVRQLPEEPNPDPSDALPPPEE